MVVSGLAHGPSRNSTDAHHALATVRAGKEPDECAGRVFEPVDHIFFDFEQPGGEPRSELADRVVALGVEVGYDEALHAQALNDN